MRRRPIYSIRRSWNRMQVGVTWKYCVHRTIVVRIPTAAFPIPIPRAMITVVQSVRTTPAATTTAHPVRLISHQATRSHGILYPCAFPLFHPRHRFRNYYPLFLTWSSSPRTGSVISVLNGPNRRIKNVFVYIGRHWIKHHPHGVRYFVRIWIVPPVLSDEPSRNSIQPRKRYYPR